MTEAEAERRRVCRALTDVLEGSALATRLDPKGFFILLNTNFEMLQGPGGLDLGPLWAPLEGEVGEDPALPGFFLGLASKAREHGLAVKLPPPVLALDDAERAAALERAFGAVEGPEQAHVAVPVADLELEAESLPELGSQDLRPLITEDLKRDVTRAIVQNLKASPVGQLVDGAQLAYRIDQYFEDLCDGERFDLRPVLDGLRQIEGFTDHGAYVALDRIQRELGAHQIELVLPELAVTEDEGKELLATAEAAEQADREARRRAAALAAATLRPSKAETGPPARAKSSGLAAPPPAAPTRGEARRDARLARYGLLGIGNKRWRAIRLGVLGVLLLAAAAGAYLTRPNRTLDASGYPVPLTRARLEDGTFVGTLDGKAWFQIPADRRRARIEAMEATLRERGLSREARIVDSRGQLLIRGLGNGNLESSRFALESPDGVSPPPPGPAREPGRPSSGSSGGSD